MTDSELEDSAKAPWTRTIVGCMGEPFVVVVLGGLADPVVEAGGGDARVVAGGEEPAEQLCAEQTGVNVGRHVSRVAARLEEATNELIEAERIRPGQLDRVVQR